MLLTVVDSAGQPQQIIVSGHETIVDRSGTTDGNGAPKVLMAANATRSGWYVQNKSASPMYVNELGSADPTTVPTIVVAAGTSFPPPGHPVSVGAISIAGVALGMFAAREW